MQHDNEYLESLYKSSTDYEINRMGIKSFKEAAKLYAERMLRKQALIELTQMGEDEVKEQCFSEKDFDNIVDTINEVGKSINLFSKLNEMADKYAASKINIENKQSSINDVKLPTLEQSKRAMLHRKIKFIDNMNKFSSRKHAYKQGWKDCYEWVMSQSNYN